MISNFQYYKGYRLGLICFTDFSCGSDHQAKKKTEQKIIFRFIFSNTFILLIITFIMMMHYIFHQNELHH